MSNGVSAVGKACTAAGNTVRNWLANSNGTNNVANQVSPEITHGDLENKTEAELEEMAQDMGLVQDAKKPEKWRDPVTGNERILIHPGHVDSKTGLPYNDPRAAAPHVHGWDKAGKKIGDPSGGSNPHFPTKMP